MRYYSDILKQFYDTEKACVEAEAEHNERVAHEKAEKERLAKERDIRLKELEAKRDELNDLLTSFMKDYGVGTNPNVKIKIGEDKYTKSINDLMNLVDKYFGV